MAEVTVEAAHFERRQGNKDAAVMWFDHALKGMPAMGCMTLAPQSRTTRCLLYSATRGICDAVCLNCAAVLIVLTHMMRSFRRCLHIHETTTDDSTQPPTITMRAARPGGGSVPDGAAECPRGCGHVPRSAAERRGPCKGDG